MEDSKKVEKQKNKLENLLVEKEKEILKLKAEAKNLKDDNVKITDNLNITSRSLKRSEKEASKAKNKSENLESTVQNLKVERSFLQKSIKKLEKSQKKEKFDKQIRDVKDFKALEATNLKTVDNVSEERDLAEDLIAYNFPVSPNPFKMLDDENNNAKSKEVFKKESLNFVETSGTVIENEEEIKPMEKNYMSAEQEKSFLKQFENIMTEALSKTKEPT